MSKDQVGFEVRVKFWWAKPHFAWKPVLNTQKKHGRNFFHWLFLMIELEPIKTRVIDGDSIELSTGITQV